MRVLRNRVVREWAGRESEIPDPPPAVIGHTRLMNFTVPGGVAYDMPKFCSLPPTPETSGDFEEMCLAAGEGVKLIKNVIIGVSIVAAIIIVLYITRGAFCDGC